MGQRMVTGYWGIDQTKIFSVEVDKFEPLFDAGDGTMYPNFKKKMYITVEYAGKVHIVVFQEWLLKADQSVVAVLKAEKEGMEVYFNDQFITAVNG